LEHLAIGQGFATGDPMPDQSHSRAVEGSLTDRLVRRLTDAHFRLGTWGGVGVGAAGILTTLLVGVLLHASAAVVTPLALVAFVIAWLSTPLASGVVVVLAAVAGIAQGALSGGVLFSPATAAVDAMRLATLVALAFVSRQLRKALLGERSAAVHDPLTGLLNRRGFFELAEREVARSRRDGTPFTIAVMDLDRFKEINDTRGHEAGDAALLRFAEHAAARLRKIDVLGRTGGDEFCLVLPLGADAASAVVRQVIDVPPQDGEPKLSVSAGVVSYPNAPESLHAAMMAADKRMYRAKHLHLGVDVEVLPE
jgi:diguanylate cyclase (GGDEF)-like protein